MTAYVKSEDSAVINQLSRAENDATAVIVRCATLEVEGHVAMPVVPTDAIVITVNDVRYFKPHPRS